MDYEQRNRLLRTGAIAAIVVVVVAAWIASTAGMAYVISEWRAHGAEHAFVKRQMAQDAQHEAEHVALRQLIQMVNQQIAQGQQRPAAPAPEPPPHK